MSHAPESARVLSAPEAALPPTPLSPISPRTHPPELRGYSLDLDELEADLGFPPGPLMRALTYLEDEAGVLHTLLHCPLLPVQKQLRALPAAATLTSSASFRAGATCCPCVQVVEDTELDAYYRAARSLLCAHATLTRARERLTRSRADVPDVLLHRAELSHLAGPASTLPLPLRPLAATLAREAQDCVEAVRTQAASPDALAAWESELSLYLLGRDASFAELASASELLTHARSAARVATASSGDEQWSKLFASWAQARTRGESEASARELLLDDPQPRPGESRLQARIRISGCIDAFERTLAATTARARSLPTQLLVLRDWQEAVSDPQLRLALAPLLARHELRELEAAPTPGGTGPAALCVTGLEALWLRVLAGDRCSADPPTGKLPAVVLFGELDPVRAGTHWHAVAEAAWQLWRENPRPQWGFDSRPPLSIPADALAVAHDICAAS